MIALDNRFYLLTNPSAGTWLDITADVLQDESQWSKGIFSSHPLERVAQVGMCRFVLKNDARSGVEHRYTPGHVNCTPGFRVKAKVKIVTTWGDHTKSQWVGWIPPDGLSNSRNGSVARFANVTAVDWMYFALNMSITLEDIGLDKTMGEQISELAASLEVQPSRISLTDYVEIFPSTNDTVRENTSLFSEMVKSAMSEMGYVYIKYEMDSAYDDILMIEGREFRSSVLPYEMTEGYEELELLSEGGDELLTDGGENIIVMDPEEFDHLTNIIDYKMVNGAHFTNRVIGKAYPRRVEVSDVTIFQLNSPIEIQPGEKISNLKVRYTVLDGYSSISAYDVALDDFAMNTAEDGSGSDISADLTITSDLGASDALFDLENTGEAIGYVTTLTIIGKPIYIGETVSQFAEVLTVDDEFYGKIEMTLDQKYISNPATTLTQISLILARYSERTNTIEEIEFTPNFSEMLAGLYMICDVGSKITLKSPDMADAEDYFIQGIDTWMVDMVTFCRMVLKPAKYETYQFWKIGIPGFSELGVNTVLGAEE